MKMILNHEKIKYEGPTTMEELEEHAREHQEHRPSIERFKREITGREFVVEYHLFTVYDEVSMFH